MDCRKMINSTWTSLQSALTLMDINTDETQIKARLLYESVKSNNYRMVKMLLKQGTDVNVTLKDDLTLLHIAVANKSYKMVKLLLKWGANVNPHKREGPKTPLLLAIENNCPEIARMLLKKGATIEKVAELGTNLFVVARKIDHIALSRLLIKHVTKLVRKTKQENQSLLIKVLMKNTRTNMKSLRDP